MPAAAVIVCLLLALVPASAQWLSYATPGVPRLPDGTLNANAPAPRAADGKPDLSGIWVPEPNRPCPPYNCDDMLTPQEFWDIGWSLKRDLPYQPWAADLIKQRRAVFGQDDPTARCLPGGILKLHTDPLLRKIVQAPGLLVVLNERNASYRQIFTDRRPLPQDPQPTWNGYSTGAWEGDTLVVKTNGIRDGVWLDRKGSPLTESGIITERFHRPSYGKLEIDVMVEDPKVYTAPWTIRLNQNLKVDTELLDYICLENEKDVGHFVRK